MQIQRAQERGAALITALLMVLVISILGIAVSQQVVSLRKVTTLNYDQSQSLNNAESALANVNRLIAINFLDPTELIGLATDSNEASNWWKNATNWAGAKEFKNSIPDGNVIPTYHIKDEGTGGLAVGTGALTKRFYRVTVKAQGSGDSVTFLQSYYVTLE